MERGVDQFILIFSPSVSFFFKEVSVKRAAENSVPTTLTENPCPAQDEEDLELEDDYDELSDEDDDDEDSFDEDEEDDDEDCNVIVDHHKVVCLSGRDQIDSGSGPRSSLEWDNDM